MPYPHLLNSLITSMRNSFVYELELRYTYVFESTKICYQQLSEQQWWQQGFSLFVNKLVPFIDIWMRIRRPAMESMFWKHSFVERQDKRLNFDLIVLWLIVYSAGGATALKSQGLVSFERRAKIVRNKSRVIIHYQPLSSSHPETSPAGCAFKHHAPCLLKKGQVWNHKQRVTNIFTSVLEHQINWAMTWWWGTQGSASVGHQTLVQWNQFQD